MTEKTKYKKCNCHEWAELGSYVCPYHGNQNVYRRPSKYIQDKRIKQKLNGIDDIRKGGRT